MVVLEGGAFSYERGTHVPEAKEEEVVKTTGVPRS